MNSEVLGHRYSYEVQVLGPSLRSKDGGIRVYKEVDRL